MEAGTVPTGAPAGVSLPSPSLLRLSSDTHLVALIRQGRSAAFEAAYNRHHRAILSFCRHMLGDPQEAEDAVQQTFFAAYHDLIGSEKPIHLRAWLFTIARNRCFSILRARREVPSDSLAESATEGLATQVQLRQDLRDLILDMQRLPHDQRAALVLAELDALSHEQIGEVLGVPRSKVKALVFQARESLAASRDARDIDCSEIRQQLATLRGGGLRRGQIRRHLRECEGCREYRKQIERQRRNFALLLPVAPTIAMKEAILAATVGGGGGVGLASAGGGVLVASVLKTTAAKGLLGTVLAAIGTAGTILAVQVFHLPGFSAMLDSHHRWTSRAPIVHERLPAPAASSGNGGELLLSSSSSPQVTTSGSAVGGAGSPAGTDSLSLNAPARPRFNSNPQGLRLSSPDARGHRVLIAPAPDRRGRSHGTRGPAGSPGSGSRSLPGPTGPLAAGDPTGGTHSGGSHGHAYGHRGRSDGDQGWQGHKHHDGHGD